MQPLLHGDFSSMFGTALKSNIKDVQTLSSAAISLNDLRKGNFNAICSAIGNAKIVMIGEATHGTEEFYSIRAEITKELMTNHGFDFCAVEADWPDAYRVSKYVGAVPQSRPSSDSNAKQALGDFQRFPTWMWRNKVVEKFVEWMKAFDESAPDVKDRKGFFGLDMYSMCSSAEQVIGYLEKFNRHSAEIIRGRFSTLGQFCDEPQDYAWSLLTGQVRSQEPQVLRMLTEFNSKYPNLVKQRGFNDQDEEFFYNYWNLKVVQHAEEYYRKSFAGGVETWNLRDSHFAETLGALLEHWTATRGKQPKCVVWAHNSHIGDASATENKRRREWNVGQLLREKHGLPNTFNIGFSTFNGTVRASHGWGNPSQEMAIIPGLAGSSEELLHEVSQMRSQEKGDADFAIITRSNSEAPVSRDAVSLLSAPRLQRFIGVQYVKETERQSHYMECCLARQYDTIIHVDNTHALQTL